MVSLSRWKAGRRSRKWIVIAATSLVALSAFLLFAPMVRGDSQDQPLFEDNFENYTVGSLPSSNWDFWFGNNATIVNSTYVSPTRSLQLSSSDHWSTVATKRLTSNSRLIGYEVYGKVDTISGPFSLTVGFAKRTGSGSNDWYAPVYFRRNGSIQVADDSYVQTYQANQWYKIRVVLDRDERTYNVWVNDVSTAKAVKDPNSDPYSIEDFGLAAEWPGINCHFDDVKVFEASVARGILPFPAGNIVMIAVGCIFIYLAIKKGYEPLLLIPIGFGALLVNIPFSGLMEPNVGFLWWIYKFGILTDIFPILLFIGLGAMIDFGALIERPWFLIFSAAGQLGIFIALLCALAVGFNPLQASSIGIIGAMDGPTAIFVTAKFAPELLAAVSVAAYSYMSMVPILQIPLSRALTTRKERLIRMEYKPKNYSKTLRIIFPIVATLITVAVAPMGTALMGSLMLGNLLKESGVVSRLAKSAENEIASITTLLLGITIGATMSAENFLAVSTIEVFALGLVAFVSAIACGILFAKLVCILTKGKVNPLIGACGISAFPMAARTAHKLGREDDPDNWLLPHAMATNVGGQIGSVVAGGVVLTYAYFLLAWLGIHVP